MADSEPQRRFFEPAEAAALLPEVDRLLGRAQALLARIEPANHPLGPEHRNGHAPAPNDPRQEIERVVAEIQALGVLVKDIRTGLVDFPHLRDGREVYLCWRRGEPYRIEWWHEIQAGFAGRKRLA